MRVQSPKSKVQSRPTTHTTDHGPASATLRRGKLLTTDYGLRTTDCSSRFTRHVAQFKVQSSRFKVQGSPFSRSNVLTFQRSNGFTLIEIALSLAVIAFALVAIIGVLPTGMQVQRDNREETIINQDQAIWADALRNGQQGLDELTNYVVGILVSTTSYQYENANKGTQLQQGPSWAVTYNQTGSFITNIFGGPPYSGAPSYPITNGLRIVGILSRPKILPMATNNAGFYSNHVVAFVRSMSGSVADKPPQTSGDVLDLAFQYRMVVEVNTNTAYYNPTNRSQVTKNLQANLYDLRFLFRWPLLANGDTGNGRQLFRAMVGGSITSANESGFGPPTGSTANLVNVWPDTLYFLQPRTYAAQ